MCGESISTFSLQRCWNLHLKNIIKILTARRNRGSRYKIKHEKVTVLLLYFNISYHTRENYMTTVSLCNHSMLQVQVGTVRVAFVVNESMYLITCQMV